MLVVKLSVFNKRKDGTIVSPDSNGFMPLYMTVLKGEELPENAKILNGTIAHNQGMTVGDVYGVSVTETETDPIHGEQYNVDMIVKLGFQDIMSLNIGGVKKFTPKAIVATDVVAETKKIKI